VELTMSPVQAAVLLAFQSADVLAVHELARLLGLDAAVVGNAVGTLATARCPLLLAGEDGVRYNGGFESALAAIRLPQLAAAEPSLSLDAGLVPGVLGEEAGDTLFVDRLYLVDAAIVRAVKTSGRLHRRELRERVRAALRFELDERVLESRIAAAVQRDYVLVDRDEPGVLVYRP
jgi:hypothetical protein